MVAQWPLILAAIYDLYTVSASISVEAVLCREPVGARWICRGGSRVSAEGTESPSEVGGGGQLRHAGPC